MNHNHPRTEQAAQAMVIPMPGAQSLWSRVNVSWAATSDVRDTIERLIEVAKRGLRQMRIDNGFAQTLRGVQTRSGLMLQLEGRNLRYAAIVALGASYLDVSQQREILGGETAAEFIQSAVSWAKASNDTGALALVAWAAAEIAQQNAEDIFRRLQNLLVQGAPVSTVECAWILSAAVAAHRLRDTQELCGKTADRLRAAQRPSGLFPHMLPSSAGGRFRSHVGSFADQVYPIQALSRLAALTDDKSVLEAAGACASKICHHQGLFGQWWWHYDIRTGDLVEGYPVYSVHQHAMAPMVLFELLEAGGADYRSHIVRGVKWFTERPEINIDLISDEHGVIWRKVGRKEPTKAVRSISAVTTALKPGAHMPGLDRIFPPQEVDYECRPYELGWILYAWLSGGVVKELVTSHLT